MTTLLRAPLVALWLILLPASADAADPWIGQRVFWKLEAQPKVGNQTVDPRLILFPATVTDVSGEWLWVGSAWIRKSDVRTVEQALDYFTDEIRRQPSAMPYLGRGSVWKEKGELENAVNDFTEAIRLSPNYKQAFNNRGNAFHDKGEYERAIQDFTEAIRLDPRYATPYRNRSRALREIGEYDRAIQDCTEAIRLNPEYASAYNSRANVFFKVGKYDKAVADNTEALRIDPKLPWAHADLAWIKATCPDERFRDGSLAVKEATEACESTDWTDCACLGALAAAYAEAGDFSEAVKWQTKSIEIMPARTLDKDRTEAQVRLELYRQKKPYRDEPKVAR